MVVIRVSNWGALVLISLAWLSVLWMTLLKVEYIMDTAVDTDFKKVLHRTSQSLSDREKTLVHILDFIEKGLVNNTIDLYDLVEREMLDIYNKDVAFFTDSSSQTQHENQQLARLKLLKKNIHRYKNEKTKTKRTDGVTKKPTVSTRKGSTKTAEKTFPPAVYAKLPPGSLGEEGRGITMEMDSMTPADMAEWDEGYRRNEFNQYISDRISVHRSLPEGRPAACRPIVYQKDLPAASVIICFYNEAWSTLIRTVHAVLARSPSRLLKQIILVDDFSILDHLKDPLDRYMKDYPKVKIIRLKSRQGLIRARLAGVEKATAPVLLFLDSHVECFNGWLEPLLDRVASKPTVVVAPVIGAIDADTFTIGYGPPLEIGILHLRMMEFRWIPIPDKEKRRRKTQADPVITPMISGGLFAVSREYFNKLGQYDRGMEIWGAENLEFSLKVWMCGGSLEIHPCSQVGHVFRKKSPYSDGDKLVKSIERNLVRLSEVWLDSYKQFYYTRIGYELGDYGNVTERKQLREQLKCHSFEWYIKNVYPDIEIPPRAVFIGEFQDLFASSPQCLDSMRLNDDAQPTMYPCHGEYGNQVWRMTELGSIDNYESCLAVDESHNEVVFQDCTTMPGPKWERLKNGQLRDEESGLCLERPDPPEKRVLARPCSSTDKQRWNWVLTDMPELKSLVH